MVKLICFAAEDSGSASHWGWLLLFVALVALYAWAKMPKGNVHIVCPHCQTKGQVSTRQVKQKVGVSGAKATGALLTGGLSLLATGLSRKQQVTEARCSKCGSVWHF
jgi:hypothetical protein